MKIIVILGLVLCSTTTLAQIVSAPNAPVTDLPLTILSGMATGAYGAQVIVEHQLADAVNSYEKIYNKRAQYYVGATLIIEKINDALDDSSKKLLTLKMDNKDLHETAYYSKRKENNKLLAEVEENLDILIKELNRQEKQVIYGEKLNLLQNTMRTLTRINRKLDVVEKNIQESEHAEEIIKMIMGNN